MKYLFFIFLLITVVITAACVSDQITTGGSSQQSDIEQRTDLNIGESVNLSAPEHELIFVEVSNVTQIPRNESSLRTLYRVQFFIKNVGETAITLEPLHYWVTDWAGVNYINERQIPERLNKDLIPGDAYYINEFYEVSNQSHEGKLIFNYQFRNQTASWIIKSN